MNNPTAIMFDVGSTLIHLDGRVLVSCLEASGVHRCTTGDALDCLALSVDARFGHMPPGDGDFKVASAWAHHLGRETPAVVDAFTRAISTANLYGPVDSGAVVVLAALRERGIQLAAVANGSGRLAIELSNAGLLDFFDYIVDSADVGVSKPDPAIYQLALGHLEVTASESWFVGDGYVTDVLGPLAVGFGRAILYDHRQVWSFLPFVDRITRLDELLSHSPRNRSCK